VSANHHYPPLAVIICLLIPCSPGFGGPPEQPAPDGKYLTRDEIVKKYDQDGDGQLSQPGQRPVRNPGNRPARFPKNVSVERDVVYGDAGSRPLKLDLILPQAKSNAPLPLIVFIHGGGWRNGDKAGGASRLLPLVATGNYVGATIDYRLSGESIWPAQIHDCKAAIRWLRANARKYHIDPERIGVWGISAGHLGRREGAGGRWRLAGPVEPRPLRGPVLRPDELSGWEEIRKRPATFCRGQAAGRHD
jgi:hypothetical protein